VIGGSVGIGIEIVWCVCVEGVDVFFVVCNFECLEYVVCELGVLSIVVFDVIDIEWFV